MTTSPIKADRLARLQSFLRRDPDNARLIADAAEAAYEAGEYGEAQHLIDRLAAIAPLEPDAVNLSGLVAIAESRFEDAVRSFEALSARDTTDPGLRFNFAWAHAMLTHYEQAADLLAPDVIAAVPRAASLKIEMLHHLDRYDEALALGETLATDHPRDERLMGSLATLALDAEQPALARVYAAQAPRDARGLAALGTIALSDDDIATAGHLFDAAINREPANPRAWMGRGLALLADERLTEALPAVDRGAELFQHHIGSWIASGWAHFAAGDLDGARDRFDHALSIDPNFGETHGALAVLDIIAGRIEEGRRRAEVALRLDRSAFGGQLARLLLLEQAGDSSGAERLRQRALATPIGPEGRTIGQALAGFARRRS